MKLGQLQGDLWILATYRNESEVSLAGVAHVRFAQVLGGGCRGTQKGDTVGMGGGKGVQRSPSLVQAQNP